MKQSVSTATDAFSPVCRHHWVIETPNGSVSQGHCKRCGLEREFRNSTEEAGREGDSFNLGGNRQRGRASKQAS